MTVWTNNIASIQGLVHLIQVGLDLGNMKIKVLNISSKKLEAIIEDLQDMLEVQDTNYK
jgi:hypothetical protein